MKQASLLFWIIVSIPQLLILIPFSIAGWLAGMIFLGLRAGFILALATPNFMSKKLKTK